MSSESSSAPHSTRIERLDVVPIFAPTQMRLQLSGEADMQDRAPLTRLLLQYHEEALQRGVKHVVIDLRELTYMSSTAMGAFVTWASTLKDVPRPSAYSLEFLGATKQRWQRGSLNALASFDPDCITVTLEP
jgi:hypothetical protein